MGQPVQIVSIVQDHTVQLNRKELERILLAPNVKDKPVAVVSIMGAYRQGKSFLMNFLLRYLRSHGKSNWMGDENTPLTGFSWSTTSERNTKGINVWDEVFLVPTSAGDELALLVMDTQGAFDDESSGDETANIFALSIMTSSVQIYNIFHNLQENDLQYLELVAEYGKLAQESTKRSEFQKLVFLIRDWQFSNFPHGAVGGRRYLQKFMSTSANQHHDNKDLRKSLSSCFSSTECFLMPQPGTEIEEEDFDGRLSKLAHKFKLQLRELVPWLVASDNLEAKKIAGKKITCEQLMNYFRVYVDVVKDGKQPRVATLLQATAEESNRNAMEEAKAFYTEQMSKETYENVQELKETHNTVLEKAKAHFRAARKIGSHDLEMRYLDMLKKEITPIFDGLSYEQKLLDLKTTEEEMMKEFQRYMNYLQERHTALEKAADKMERRAQYAMMQSQMYSLVGSLAATMAPFITAVTVALPPAGLLLGATTSQLLGTLAGGMANISRMADEDDFPAAASLRPEMVLGPLSQLSGVNFDPNCRAVAAPGAGLFTPMFDNLIAALTVGHTGGIHGTDANLRARTHGLPGGNHGTDANHRARTRGLPGGNHGTDANLPPGYQSQMM